MDTQGSKFAFVDDVVVESKLEDGVWLHLSGPDGEPLYLGADKTKPVRVKVRSTASRAYEAHQDAVTRKALAENRKAKNDAQRQQAVLNQMKREGPKGFAALVAAFENTSPEALGVWIPSDDEAVAFASHPKTKFIVDQVNAFAADQSNFGHEGNADAA